MTNFTYTSPLPVATNDPSVDQPNMTVNNTSNAGIWEVDHVGFNENNGGTHLQVSFSSNNVPTVPTTFPTAFTNTVGSLPQLFFYSGDATQSSGQYSTASNFSTFLLGGMILKGGSLTMTASPQTFTYAGLSPALQPFINSSLLFLPFTNDGLSVGVASSSATGFTLTIGQLPHVVNFLAIGF